MFQTCGDQVGEVAVFVEAGAGQVEAAWGDCVVDADVETVFLSDISIDFKTKGKVDWSAGSKGAKVRQA